MNRHASGALRFARAYAWTFVASAGVVAFAVSLCQRTINLTDEGYLLSQAVDMLSGKVLYRDMDAFVSPGIWFLLAGLFSVTEPSVLASRGLALGGYLATVFLAYRIAARLTSRAWAWGAVGILMIFTVWAFPAWTIAFYSPSRSFALAALDRLEWASRRTGQSSVRIAIGSLAFKQNQSVRPGGCVAGHGAVCLEQGELPQVGAALSRPGWGWEQGPPASGPGRYFAYSGALQEMYELLVLTMRPWAGRTSPARPSACGPTRLVRRRTLTYCCSPVPAPNRSIPDSRFWPGCLRLCLLRPHVLLFWLPVVGLRPVSRSPSTAVEASAHDVNAAVLAVAACIFLGVFPRADFNHLINVFQPTTAGRRGVSDRGARNLLLRAASRPRIRHGASRLYAGVAVSVHPRSMSTRPRIRGGDLVSAIEKNLLDFHVHAIQERTRDGDAVLTVPALATLNFLANRRVPGRYYNLYEHHIAHDGGAGVVEASEANRVSLVVADYNNFFSDRVGLRVYAPKLASYLRTHFEPEFDVASDRFHTCVAKSRPTTSRSTSWPR
jgi:hypothetical protein